MTTQTNYNQQATEALLNCATSIKIKLSNTKECPWKHAVGHNNHYKITFKNFNGSYSHDFWQSIIASEEGTAPTAYDIIACLVWDTPESFEEFCCEMGYDPDSRRAEKIWKTSLAMTRNLRKIFNEAQREILSKIK